MRLLTLKMTAIHDRHCAVGSSWWSRGLDLCLLLQRQVVLLHLLPQCEVNYCFREQLRRSTSRDCGNFCNLISAKLRRTQAHIVEGRACR